MGSEMRIGQGTILLAVAAFSIAETVSEADKKEGVAQLERTRAGVIETAKALSEAQWKFKPAPERWSVAETLEHIALAEDMLFDLASKRVMQAPAGKPDRNVKAIDQLVLKMVPDRSNKQQAPEPLVPKSNASPQQSLDHFLKSRERTIAFLKDTSGLREHVFDSPVGQPLDAYQWLLFISAHSERHTRQMQELKSDPNFPKN